MKFNSCVPNLILNTKAKLLVILPVCAVVLLSLLPSECSAQRRRARSRGPQIGDIILFESHQTFGEQRYALVTNTDQYSRIELELLKNNGDVEKMSVISNSGFLWELVNRLEQKVALTSRTWKSADESYVIKAKMLRVEQDKVRLEKEDGSSIAVPIKKLRKRDQEYIEKNKDSAALEKANPFEVESSEALPDEVIELMDRRVLLMEHDARHQRLARLYPGLVIGDIVRYHGTGRDEGVKYGIVVSMNNPFLVVESFDEYGELKRDPFFRSSSWTFYDRQFIPIPMKPRKWNSASGKHSILATLQEVKEENVVLKKEDGTKLTLELAKLSETDQKHVNRVQAQLNVRNDKQLVEDRKSYDEDLQILLSRRRELLKNASLNYEVALDSSKMRSIKMRRGPIKLSGSSQPAPIESFTLAVPLRMPQHASLSRVGYAREGGMVALTAFSHFRGKPTLAVVDLETQDVITNFDSDEIGDEGELLAISPSGKTLLVASTILFDKQVELWRNENGQLKKLGTFDYDTFWKPEAYLASDTCGVIQSSDGFLTFFDITDRIKPTHVISVGRFGGRRSFQVAGGEQKAIFVLSQDSERLFAIDVQTKKCLGGIDFSRGNKNRSSSFNFARVTSDGKTVVYVEQSRLSVYSLETGKKISSRDFKGYEPTFFGASKDQFQYLGDGLVLTASGAVHDLERGVEIGSVDRKNISRDARYFANGARIIADADHLSNGSFGGNTMRTTNRSGNRQERATAINALREDGRYEVTQVEIRVEQLPVDEITEFAKNVVEDDIVTLDEGDTIEASVVIDGPQQLANELEEYVHDSLEEGGVKVVRRSDFSIELSYEDLGPRTKTYRVIGFGMGTGERSKTVTLHEKRCSAVLKYRGEVVWSKTKAAILSNFISDVSFEQMTKLSEKMDAEMLFDFEIPTRARLLPESRRGKFSWK